MPPHLHITLPRQVLRGGAILLGFLLMQFASLQAAAQEESSMNSTTHHGIPYRTGPQLAEEMKERCRLDLYIPLRTQNFATVVWFHGGGLRMGEKHIPEELKDQGIAIAAPNYRLFPDAKAPDYIDDAAAATAWVLQNIEAYGGNPERVFVSGHSAGGYLAMMAGLDDQYLEQYGASTSQLAGLIPFSGHTITHFTVREERGIPDTRPIVDDLAPLYHVRADAPPLILITGDRELEMLGRYEETAYMWRMMKVAGHQDTHLYELQGFDHGTMVGPGHALLLEHVRRLCAEP